MNPFLFIYQKFLKISLIRSIYLKNKFPGLGIDHRSNLLIKGNLNYKQKTSIGEGSNIVINQSDTLKLGYNCYIGRYTEIGPNRKISIGDHTSIQDRCILLGQVEIGRYCLLAPNVYISSGHHAYNTHPWLTIREQDILKLEQSDNEKNLSRVIIEDDCWIGINSVITPGVIIHKGSVIGANSVVTKDVAPYTVVAGSPAKFIKNRLTFTPPSEINYLNPKDLPYFYSGFEVTKTEINLNKMSMGLIANNQFSICLNASQGEFIHLRVRVAEVDSLEINYASQTEKVYSYMSDIRFRIESTDNMFFFIAKTNNNEAQIIVEKAWIL